jgi:hypothetical protein
MSEQRIILGLTGRAQHGKDSAASILVEEYGFIQMAFADTLRAMMMTLDPVVSIGPDGDFVRYGDAIGAVGYEGAKTQVPEVRRLLQVFGTEVMREQFGANVWVDLLDKRVCESANPTNGAPVVITDVRFPNEAAWVGNHGNLMRVKRINEDGSPFDNGLGREHPSEQFIDSLPVQWEFEAKNLEDLAQNVRVVASYLVNGSPWEEAPRVPQARA